MKISSIGIRTMLASGLVLAMLGGCGRRTPTTDQTGPSTAAPSAGAAAGSSAPGSSATPPPAPATGAK